MKLAFATLLLPLAACAGAGGREERPYPDRVYTADAKLVRQATRDALRQAIFHLEKEEPDLLTGVLNEDAGFSWRVSVATKAENGVVTVRTTLEIVRDSNIQPIRSIFRNAAEAGVDDEALKGGSTKAARNDRREIQESRTEGDDVREERIRAISDRVERFLIDLDSRIPAK